jgi:hypothetical protein
MPQAISKLCRECHRRWSTGPFKNRIRPHKHQRRRKNIGKLWPLEQENHLQTLVPSHGPTLKPNSSYAYVELCWKKNSMYVATTQCRGDFHWHGWFRETRKRWIDHTQGLFFSLLLTSRSPTSQCLYAWFALGILHPLVAGASLWFFSRRAFSSLLVGETEPHDQAKRVYSRWRKQRNCFPCKM